MPLLLCRGRDSRAELVRQGDDRLQGLHERVHGVQRGAAEHPGVEVALAAREAHVEVDEPARAEVEGRHVLTRHAAVEDDARVRSALVRLEELDDRVAARLLFPVEGDAHVDRELARTREQLRRLQQEVRVPLVVHRAAGVEIAVADLGLEGIGLPEVERRRRLHVEMAVEHDRGRVAVSARRGDLPDREREGGRLHEPGLAARSSHEVADPLAGAPHVAGMRRVRAHAGDAEELVELLEPGLIGTVSHRPASLAGCEHVQAAGAAERRGADEMTSATTTSPIQAPPTTGSSATSAIAEPTKTLAR